VVRSGVLMLVASSCQAQRERERKRDGESEKEGGWGGAERVSPNPPLIGGGREAAEEARSGMYSKRAKGVCHTKTQGGGVTGQG
jgi:hypothetical protein